MAKELVIEIDPVLLETGLWRDCCLLPSGAKFSMVWWKADGPHSIGTLVVCTECWQREKMT